MTLQVFIGHEPRLALATQVCLRSLLAHASIEIDWRTINREVLGQSYRRPVRLDPEGRTWDVISNAPMATAFSLARFWVPEIGTEWALYVDSDFLFRADVAQLLNQSNPRRAIQVVPQHHQPVDELKMDGQVQTAYARKNESSCVLWNLSHPANHRLRWTDLNHRPGLWLHRFGWLESEEIGELASEWNTLDEYGSVAQEVRAYHYTRGTPDIHPDRKALPHADEWFSYLTNNELKQITAQWLREDYQCKPASSVTA